MGRRGFLLPASAIAAALFTSGVARAEMTFRAVTVDNPALCRPACPTAILAEGEITRNSSKAFVEFVARQLPQRGKGLSNVVFIQSPGGSVVGSMMLGTVWRKLGTMVVVARPDAPAAGWFAAENTQASRLTSASCYSACVYALMGATKRVIPEQSQLGVHQAHTIEYVRDLANNSGGNRQVTGSNRPLDFLRAYAKSMGTDPALIDLAQRTPPSSIHVLSQQEIRRFRLSTPRR